MASTFKFINKAKFIDPLIGKATNEVLLGTSASDFLLNQDSNAVELSVCWSSQTEQRHPDTQTDADRMQTSVLDPDATILKLRITSLKQSIANASNAAIAPVTETNQENTLPSEYGSCAEIADVDEEELDRINASELEHKGRFVWL